MSDKKTKIRKEGDSLCFCDDLDPDTHYKEGRKMTGWIMDVIEEIKGYPDYQVFDDKNSKIHNVLEGNINGTGRTLLVETGFEKRAIAIMKSKTLEYYPNFDWDRFLFNALECRNKHSVDSLIRRMIRESEGRM